MLLQSTSLGPLYRANSGGPSSRTRLEHITSTLLGRDSGPIRCARHLSLALDFGQDDPVITVHRLLFEAGFQDPEALRIPYGHALRSMICQVNPTIPPLVVSTAKPLEVLRQAFLLGLCTRVRFDSARPVLWTQASLTRRLELFDATEFYA